MGRHRYCSSTLLMGRHRRWRDIDPSTLLIQRRRVLRDRAREECGTREYTSLEIRITHRRCRRVNRGDTRGRKDNTKSRNQAKFRWDMTLRGELALRVHMLLERKICTQVVGGRAVADEDAPFTAEISLLVRRVEQTHLPKMITRKERPLTCHKLIRTKMPNLRVWNTVDPSDRVHV